jgi:hypothetical protein
MSEDDLDDLRAELSDYAAPQKQGGRTAREERIIAGFEEIQRFVDDHGRVPQHGDDRDIFERLYATRLDRIRAQADCRTLLEPLDHQGLLTASEVNSSDEALSDDELLAELGGLKGAVESVTTLRHVRSSAEKRAAEDVATRTSCADFDRFAPLFRQVQADLEAGLRSARPFELKAEIEAGRFFIVGGQKAYVAEKGEEFTNANGQREARLRVIFDNGTESNLLMRSLQRALNDDLAGRRISDPEAGPLFAGLRAEGDVPSGIIYVLRSKSDHPVVVQNRDLIHKIGVTTESVERRVAGANLQPTFLMANVEVVASYTLYHIHRSKLETLIHRVFASARLEIEILDRFGRPVVPEEWFLVPLFVIDEAVERIKDGTITDYVYDPSLARLRLG